jgi:hypothetical protein
MNDPILDILEIRLQEAARQQIYPATPDLAGQVRRKLAKAKRSAWRLRPAWIVLALALILLTFLGVPPVRAALLEFLQVGAIRIQLIKPSATPTLTPSATVQSAAQVEDLPFTPIPIAPITATPIPVELPELEQLAGETTLEEVEEKANFQILLPTYPDDLGEPDRVYFQDIGGPAVLLIWLDAGTKDTVRLSLLLLTNDAVAYKSQPRVIETTQVNGEQALWTEGEHMLQIDPDGYDMKSFIVRGHVLIWTQGNITYRLETDLEMEEGVRIAESLR